MNRPPFVWALSLPARAPNRSIRAWSSPICELHKSSICRVCSINRLQQSTAVDLVFPVGEPHGRQLQAHLFRVGKGACTIDP
jgi:hypothetical protein